MILQHHETMDGSGYPKGLFSADLTDAMLKLRPDKCFLGLETAFKEIVLDVGNRLLAAIEIVN